MQEQPIHDMIAETYNLQDDTSSIVAKHLLCCVLEIAKHDGSKYIRGVNSGYFWEKMEKALAEIGYQPIKKD